MKSDSIKITNYVLTSLVLIAYFVATGWDNLFAVIYMFLLTMSPLAINVIITLFAKNRASQIILLCTAIAYSSWACFLFVDVTYLSTGAQAGFTLLLTAIVAAPVLLIAWAACLIIEVTKRRKEALA